MRGTLGNDGALVLCFLRTSGATRLVRIPTRTQDLRYFPNR